MLGSAASAGEFRQSLDKGLISPEFIRNLSDKLISASHAADALGRSCVVRKDKFFSDKKKVVSAKFKIGKYFARADGLKWIVADDNQNVQISFNLTPEQAVEYFRRKAFWISGVEDQRFIDAVKSELDRVLSEGETYDQFSDSFKIFFNEYGITPNNPIRLDTIFRTNLFTAYTAGQVKQVEEVTDRFPIWRYIAVHDNRTRLSHAMLSNKFFRSGPYPPISYNCRCTPQFIHELQLPQLGEIQVYDSIYDLIDPSEVIDFLSNNTFDQWISDNPVSPDIQNIIDQG